MFALGGVSSLDIPTPETLVLDQWLCIPPVVPSEALTTNFLLRSPHEPARRKTNRFLSVFYPQPIVAGRLLSLAGVSYYRDGELELKGKVENWIAISLDGFWPPERVSADYIVAVDRPCVHEPDVTKAAAGDAPLPQQPTRPSIEIIKSF